ncbi:MAG: Asp-tRNA(Asn)/Glu-tRNA(Gln) amidotransferase subunit GatC [Aquificae bacterium]|nr:Asp-tRNA(Asn)/Glu-tRNA(Gln) amidotransferase subunit GatC [Aquificota bacterium]
MLKKEDVIKVAQLAKLRLKEEEIELFSKQLPQIVSFVEKLSELDTEDVKPFYEVIEKTTPLREDIPQKGLTQEQALSNAPEAENGFFVVPRVVEKD